MAIQRLQNCFSPASFVNTRCTFQRASDAKIFHGWVESFDDREIAVRLVADQLKEKDKFFFQVFGLEQDIRFAGALHTMLANTFGFGDAAHVGTSLCMFSILGDFKISTGQGNARLTNQGMSAFFVVDGCSLNEEPIDLLDVSQSGISAVLEADLKRDQHLTARVTTINGEVEMQVSVKNRRPYRNGGTRYGFFIEEMHRIDRLRWSQVFSQF